jgi:hypothetical protein
MDLLMRSLGATKPNPYEAPVVKSQKYPLSGCLLFSAFVMLALLAIGSVS